MILEPITTYWPFLSSWMFGMKVRLIFKAFCLNCYCWPLLNYAELYLTPAPFKDDSDPN